MSTNMFLEIPEYLRGNDDYPLEATLRTISYRGVKLVFVDKGEEGKRAEIVIKLLSNLYLSKYVEMIPRSIVINDFHYNKFYISDFGDIRSFRARSLDLVHIGNLYVDKEIAREEFIRDATFAYNKPIGTIVIKSSPNLNLRLQDLDMLINNNKCLVNIIFDGDCSEIDNSEDGYWKSCELGDDDECN